MGYVAKGCGEADPTYTHNLVFLFRDARILRKSVGQESGNCCVFGALFIFVKRKWTAATAEKISDLLAFLQNLPGGAER